MAKEGGARIGGATWLVMAGVVVVLGGGGAAAYLRWPAHTPTTPAPAPTAAPAVAMTSPQAPAAAPPPAATAPAERPPTAPSFDVVRVTPEGNAVIAGRAQPGAEVIVRDGDRELGHVQA